MNLALATPTHHRGSPGDYLCRQGGDYAADAVRGHALSLRATQEEDGSGTFEGWACIYGVRDSYGTTFDQGCFVRGGLQDTPYPLLWMHSGMVPVGTFTAEDRDTGLWITGGWDPTPDGQTARMRARTGSAPELSVGFVWLDDGGEDDPDLITSARLVETSQITLRMAAVPGSGFQAVREDDPLDAASAARARALLTLSMALTD